MANYYTHSVIQPEIPAHLLTKFHIAILDAFDILKKEFDREHGKTYYLSAPNGLHFTAFDRDYTEEELADCDPAIVEFFKINKELYEDDLIALFQVIIKDSNGELPWISIEQAYTCSKMLPDGYGGSAIFITADDMQFSSTSQWLEQRIGEVESGDTGPHTEDPEASAPQDEKPLLCIKLQNGEFQRVVSNRPEALPDCMIVDFGFDRHHYAPEDIMAIQQRDGDQIEFVGHIEPVSVCGNDLELIREQLAKNS